MVRTEAVKDRTIHIIAECCSNHGGSMPLARQMIVESKLCGASFAKFQLYDISDYENHPAYERLKEALLNKKQLRHLKRYCDKVGITFLCTPFYPEAVEVLESIGVEYYKVREKDSNNKKILEAVASTDKITFVSVYNDFDLSYLNDLFGNNLRLLYAVPYYPPNPDDMNLMRLTRSYLYDGISDHYPGILSSLIAAIILKSRQKPEVFIEKHVIIDHEMPTVDAKVSIDFEQLKELIIYLNLMERMM